jgi:hypothetical protein
LYLPVLSRQQPGSNKARPRLALGGRWPSHFHPSGEPQPSEADIKVSRDLIRAGQLLKIEVLDHVIVGAGDKRTSLRELGHFFQ